MAEGFFSRWSARKTQVRQGGVVTSAAPHGFEQNRPQAQINQAQAATNKKATNDKLTGLKASEIHPGGAPSAAVDAAPTPAPTLADVQALTADADFRPYVAQSVAPQVRNAAFKKLFADPHFNVMDGLDTYIDDYSRPDPLSAALLQRMASAQFLGLVPPEAPPAASADGPAAITDTAAQPEPIRGAPDVQPPAPVAEPSAPAPVPQEAAPETAPLPPSDPAGVSSLQAAQAHSHCPHPTPSNSVTSER